MPATSPPLSTPPPQQQPGITLRSLHPRSTKDQTANLGETLAEGPHLPLPERKGLVLNECARRSNRPVGARQFAIFISQFPLGNSKVVHCYSFAYPIPFVDRRLPVGSEYIDLSSDTVTKPT